MGAARTTARRTALLAAALLAGASPALAAEQDGEVWGIATATGSIRGKLLASAEVSIRSMDEGTRRPTVLLLPTIGYQATGRLSLWTGYLRVVTYVDGGAAMRENRIFAQGSWVIGGFASGSLSSRTRLEHRRVEGRAGTGVRVRQQLRWTKPLAPKGPGAVVSSEVFVALNSTDFGARAGFDQVRNFVGLNVPIAKGLTVEGGYMNRYIRRSGIPDRIDHIVPITVALRF